MSCLARQAKISWQEAEENKNNFDEDMLNAKWARWYKCSLCEKDYHGVVRSALGYATRSKLHGPRHRATFLSAGNLSDLMVESHLWDEAKQLLSEQIPLALETFGPDDDETLRFRWRYALVLQIEEKYTEAVAILEDVARRYRRVFGISHPMTAKSQGVLENARERLSNS